MVKRPLVFTLDNLSRYQRTSRITFLECAGNSGALNAPQPAKADIQTIHGAICDLEAGLDVVLARHSLSGVMQKQGQV